MDAFSSKPFADSAKLDPPTRVRHAVVALTTLMAVLLYLDRVCLAITERSIRADLGLSKREGGWLLSAFFWTYAVGQVPAGWLSDRFGARRMLALYILLWSVFTGLMGLATSLVALLLLRGACGLAQAGAYPTSAGMVSKWVPFAARGRASSIVATGGRIGGAVAPVLTAYLMAVCIAAAVHVGALHSFLASGWRPVLVLYGAAGVLVAGLFWKVVRDRPRDHPTCNEAERELIEQGLPPMMTSPHGRVGGLPLGAILRSRSMWLSSIAQFGTNFGWVFLLTWFPGYLDEVHHVSLLERGWLSSLPLAVGMSGMLAGGWVTDRLTHRLGVRWGRALPMGATRFVAAAAFLACILLDSPWGATAALCVVAVFTDLGTPALWAMMQDVGGRHVGSILGWGNMWGSIGAALSPVVLEALIGPGRWALAFGACALAFIVSGVAALGIDATVPVLPADGIKET